MATNIDHLIYKLETEVSGRKITEIIKEISTMGAAATKAIPSLQKVKDKIMVEDRYKYTRKMVVAEILKAIETISAVAGPSSTRGAPSYPEISPRMPQVAPRQQPVRIIEQNEMVLTCSQCEARLMEPEPGTLRFCTQCGAPLTAPTPTPKKGYCPACGAELPDEAKFCVTCGAAVTESW